MDGIDAIEYTLTDRWITFSDLDFHNGDITQSIDIRITLGSLSAEAKQERRFGLALRGWSLNGELVNEPDEDSEAVVTVQLSVDSSLDGEWKLYTSRESNKILSSEDRALFGVVRLGGDVDRHLTWGRALHLLT